MRASYRISHILAKHKKSFKESEVVRKASVEAAYTLVGDFKNKTDIVAGHQRDTDACECFSLQFDESTDMVDVAQLCVFIRMFFGDVSAKEELLTILPLRGHTTGEDISDALMEFVNEQIAHLHHS